MNFILITQDFPPVTGGIQTYSYELARRWMTKTNHFEIIAPTARNSIFTDKTLTCPVHRIPCPNTMLPYCSVPLISLMANWNRYPVIFHSQWQTLPASLFSRKVAYPRKIFVAAHARELLFNPFGKNNFLAKKYAGYRKKALSGVDHFFPVSHYTAGLLNQLGVGDQKMTVVPNGTDPIRFYPYPVRLLKEKLDLHGRFILLTITRLVARKGIDTVIRALPDIVGKHPEIMYLIGGTGPERENLEHLISEKGVSDHVRFLGKIPDEDLSAFYNLCDIFVMPSKTVIPDVEGFGIVFLEAAACGKPVIGSYSGGIPDAVKHEETGLLVNESEPGELAGAVLRLVEDESLRKKLGFNGLQHIRKEANWDVVADKIYDIMQQIAADYT